MEEEPQPRRWPQLAVVVLLLALMPAVFAGAQEISPEITLEPSSGMAGTDVQVDGQGFTPNLNGPCVVKFNDVEVADCIVDNQGEFQVVFAVPDDASSGTAEVEACNDCGISNETATAPFEVTPPPTTTTTTTTTTTVPPTTTTTVAPTTTTTTTPTTTAPATTTTTVPPSTTTTVPLTQPLRLSEPPSGPMTVGFDPEIGVIGEGILGGPATVLPLGPHIGVPPEGFRPRCRPPEHASVVDFDDLEPGTDARESYADLGVHFDVGRTESVTEFVESDRPLLVERATEFGSISEPNVALAESVNRDKDAVQIRFDTPQRIIGLYTGEPDDWANMQVGLADNQDLPEDVEPAKDLINQSGMTPVTTCMLIILPEGQATTSVLLRTAYDRSNLRFDRLFFSDDPTYTLPAVTEGFVNLSHELRTENIDVSGPVSLTGAAGPTSRPGDTTDRYVDTVRVTYTGASGTRYHSVEAEVETPSEGRGTSSWRLDNVRLPTGTTTIALTATGPGVVATDTVEVTGVTPELLLREREGTFDLMPIGIEVNQGISGTVVPVDPGDSIPAPHQPFNIENRSTVVRVYANLDWGEEGPPRGTDSLPTDALLFGFRDGRLLPGSPLVANPPRIEVTERTDSVPADVATLQDLRTERTTSWNFELPLSWARGEIDVWAWINPPGPSHWEEAPGAQGDANTLRMEGIEFDYVAPRPVHLVLMDYYWNRDGVIGNALVDGSTLAVMLDEWERMFPLPYGGLPVHGYTLKSWAERPCDGEDLVDPEEDECSRPPVPGIPVWDNDILNAELADWIAREDQVYVPTIFDPSSPIGCSGRAGYTTPLFHAGACSATVAQEAAHSNGLIHLSDEHGELKGGAAYDRYSDDHGALEDDTAGWDPGTGQPVPGGDAHTHDFMSYGSSPKWISLATWNKLAFELRRTNPEATMPPRGLLVANGEFPEATGAFVVSGVVDLEDEDVDSDPVEENAIERVIRIDELPEPPSVEDATHRLVLVGPDDETLAERQFRVDEPTHPGYEVGFSQYLPALEQAERIELHDEEGIVATIDLGPDTIEDLSELDTGEPESQPSWGDLLPIIRSPALSQVIPPTSSIRFDAAMAGELGSDTEIEWLLDGEQAGEAETLFLAGLEEGEHELTLRLSNERGAGQNSVSFTVGEDRDGDGLWDAWEDEVGLDSDDSADARSDRDRDGLSALREQVAGSDPFALDSDGDGYSDRVEVEGGSDPADSDSVPEALHGHFGEPVPTIDDTATADSDGDTETADSDGLPLLPIVLGGLVLLASAGGWAWWRTGKPSSSAD